MLANYNYCWFEMYVKNKVRMECNEKDEAVLARESVINKVVVQDFPGTKSVWTKHMPYSQNKKVFINYK